MDPVGTAPDVSQSPTITTPAMMTGVGVLLGTAAYMSPEQAKGRAADKRSDVWALGCVLYEMLTGARAFEGDDVSDTLAAVLRGEPTYTAPTPDLMRFSLTLPAGQVLGITSPDRDLVIAPDGRHLVYQEGSTGASSQLVVRAIDQLETVRLRGPAGSRWPFISPDSEWIGFFVQGPGGSQGGGELRKVSMKGGPPITVCRVQAPLTGASWGPDDTIIFTTSDPRTGLLSVPGGGGAGAHKARSG